MLDRTHQQAMRLKKANPSRGGDAKPGISPGRPPSYRKESVLRLQGRTLRLTILCLLGALALASPAAAGPESGKVRFVQENDSAFDRFTYAPDAGQREWMRTHYDRMKTYSGYFDSRTSWFTNAWAYKDLYAIYKKDTALLAQHPDWVLKAPGGSKLYIPWGCGGGTCPQYAADIGNPDFRAAWIAEARATMSQGYRGLFIDDVNMEFRVGDGNGDEVAPIDPRTGQTMTEAAWRRYVADFVVEVRAALPGVEIAHNPIWFSGHDDPDVARALLAADVIDLERGVNDDGLTAGGGQFGYETLLAHVDWLQARGKAVVFDSYTRTQAGAEYNLASYFLVNESRDGFRTNYRTTPEDWWTGYDVNLGAATGERFKWNGLLRRNFERGYVLVNQPGRATQTVLTAGGEGPDGAARPTVSLPGASGAVVVTSPDTSVAVPPVVEEPVLSDSGAAPRPGQSQPLPTDSGLRARSVRRTFARASVRLRARRARTAVSVRGRVTNHAGGRVSVILRRQVGRRWRVVKRASVSLRRNGAFRKRFSRLERGRYRVTGSYRGAPRAAVSRSLRVRRPTA